MSGERLWIAAAVIVVAGGLAGGFAMIGSPTHQRDLALDDRRVEDLDGIQGALQHRYHPSDTSMKPLPRTLPDDLTAPYTKMAVTIADPASGVPYRYVKLSTTRFRLCATFAAPSEHDRGKWTHPAGAACYTFDTASSSNPVAHDGPASSSAKKRATREAS